MNFYQLGSKYLTTNLQPYLAKLAPPLAQAFTAQSLWCLAFRPWVGRMQFVPSALLALTALGLSRVHSILRQAVNAGVMKPWDYLIVHLPLSLHFGWITCATLVSKYASKPAYSLHRSLPFSYIIHAWLTGYVNPPCVLYIGQSQWLVCCGSFKNRR